MHIGSVEEELSDQEDLDIDKYEETESEANDLSHDSEKIQCEPDLDTNIENCEEMESKLKEFTDDTEKSKYEKPDMTFPKLIAQAISSNPEGALSLSDIYKAINAKYPYYNLESQNWQNHIRHTLSHSKNFVKGEQIDNRTSLWTISKFAKKSLFEPKKKTPKKVLKCKSCSMNQGEMSIVCSGAIGTTLPGTQTTPAVH